VNRTLCMLLLPFVALSVAPWANAHPSQQLQGTYDVLVCKGPCDFSDDANVLVKGVLVLESKPFSQEAVARLRSGGFRQASAGFRVVNGHFVDLSDMNGCFVLHTLEHTSSNAHLIPKGLTNWSIEADSLAFELYAGVDAWYVVSVAWLNGHFRGHGVSGFANLPAPKVPEDIVVGRRAGKTITCLAAATGEDGD